MSSLFKIAIVGCGLGGAAIALLLQKRGYNIEVFEQADRFNQIGAGIHLTPNMLKALKELDVESKLLEKGYQPKSYTSRNGLTGEQLFKLPLHKSDEVYGANYITIHRYDFHQAMVEGLDKKNIFFGKQLTEIEQTPDFVKLIFRDGSTSNADIVIGADGISSLIRKSIRGESTPKFTGHVAYRSVIQISTLNSPPIDDYTKWWGNDKFIVSYYLNPLKNLFYFVAGFKTEKWTTANSYCQGTRDELLSEFYGFHQNIYNVLENSSDFRKWALFESPPNSVLHTGRIVLIGDACHPMKPHMAQGAAMAVEDGVVLARCLEEVGCKKWEKAFELYNENRRGRVAQIQSISNNSDWLKFPSNPKWVFSYDAWHTALKSKD